MRRHPTTTFLMVLAIAAFSGALLRAVAPSGQEAAAKTPNAARIARGAHLVRTMGCNDCHTPVEDGPARPRARHVARADRPSRGREAAAAAGAAARSLDRRHRGDRTRRSPDRGASASPRTSRPITRPVSASGPRSMFIATMRTGRHEGKGRPILPPMPYPILGGARRRGHQERVRVSPVADAGEEPGAGAGRSRGGEAVMTRLGARGRGRARRCLGRGAARGGSRAVRAARA